MKNKICFVLIIFVLSFATLFAIPQKQVEAVGFGLAIPGGITLGAGTYALGALGLAGVVGLAGYAEYEQEINAHAQQVWKDGTTTAMDSLNYSIDKAVGAGVGVVELSSGFIDYASTEIHGIVATILNVGNIYTLDADTFRVGNFNGGADIKIYPEEGKQMFYRGKEITYFSFQAGSNGTGYQGSLKETNTMFNYAFNKKFTRAQALSIEGQMRQVIRRSEVFALANAMGAGITDGAIGAEYPNTRAKVLEAWEGMRDAGLVLPVDSAVPLSSVDGSPLTYNPTADNYTGIDGGVYEGTPAWAFPQPKIRVANPDIPNSVPTTGVYVDTPVLTGNPAYDDTIINNPAIPKTTTNVQTGVTVGNPDIAITEPLPPVDGGGGTPPADGAACAKLKMPIFSPLKEQFSISFPFSIPWDIGRAINAAFSEIGDEKPEFKLDLKLMDKKHTINITLPKMFDDWKPFTDSLLLFIFDVLIMFGIYRFVKGAGS